MHSNLVPCKSDNRPSMGDQLSRTPNFSQLNPFSLEPFVNEHPS